MGTKMAVSFANIFMAKIETTLIQQSETKPKEWRRYIDDIFSPWDSHEKNVDQFIEQANKFHPTIKFTAEISENEITFLDTEVFKGERLKKESILDIKTHYKSSGMRTFRTLRVLHSDWLMGKWSVLIGREKWSRD